MKIHLYVLSYLPYIDVASVVNIDEKGERVYVHYKDRIIIYTIWYYIEDERLDSWIPFSFIESTSISSTNSAPKRGRPRKHPAVEKVSKIPV